MKQFLVFLFLLCAASVSAQDVIVKKDGTTILSKVIEIGTSEVKYKKFSNQNGPTYSVGKSELQAINYENGDKDSFNTQASQRPSQNGQETSINMLPITEEDKAANNAALESWAVKAMPSFEGKVKDKKPNILYCVLRPTHDSYIADANLELSFKGSPLQDGIIDNYRGSNIIVIVKNKSHK